MQMSYEEQKAQGDAIYQIATDMKVVKRWWPILAVAFALIGSTISITVGIYKYSDSKASSKDVKALYEQIISLHNDVRDIASKFREHIRLDSVDKVNTARETDERINENQKNIDRLFNILERRSNRRLTSTTYYTQKYSTNADGTRQIQNVPHRSYNR